MNSTDRLLAALVLLADDYADLMVDVLGPDWDRYLADLRDLVDAPPTSRESTEWQDNLDDLLERLLAGPAGDLVRAVARGSVAVTERLRSWQPADQPVGGDADLGAAPPAERADVSLTARSRSRVVNLELTDDGRALPSTTPLRSDRPVVVRYSIGDRSELSLVPAGAAPLPETALPATDDGHWLDVVADQVGTTNTARFAIFLPLTGPAWQCDCPHDGHHCRAEDRRVFVDMSFPAPDEETQVVIQVATYFGANLLQLHTVCADVDADTTATRGADTEPATNETGLRLRADITYSLHPQLSAPEKLPERDLSIAASAPPDSEGTHRLLIHGAAGATIAFGLAEARSRDAVLHARELLRTIHFVTDGGTRRNLLDAHDAKSPDTFRDDLRRLAEAGWTLWTALFSDKLDQASEIRSAMAGSQRIQICTAGTVELAFPWAMVYDIPLTRRGDELTFCRLVDAWAGSAPMLGVDQGECPHVAGHQPDMLCPYGFWGFRHTLEQPRSVPAGGRLSVEIPLLAEPSVAVAGLSPALDDTFTRPHLQAVGTALGARLQLTPYYSVSELRDGLATADLPLAYFYCHGVRSALAGTAGSVPELVLDEGSSLRPQDLVGLRLTAWSVEHWRVVRPLVFINGCHTADLTPEDLVTFVDAFINVGAAGVVGTEITLHQSVAAEAAETFLTSFAAGHNVGVAIARLRRQLLGKGNLLGLAYTPYCSAGLSLTSLIPSAVGGG